MVPKLTTKLAKISKRFRAVLFRMVPKRVQNQEQLDTCFRAVLFRMVPKHYRVDVKQHILF